MHKRVAHLPLAPYASISASLLSILFAPFPHIAYSDKQVDWGKPDPANSLHKHTNRHVGQLLYFLGEKTVQGGRLEVGTQDQDRKHKKHQSEEDSGRQQGPTSDEGYPASRLEKMSSARRLN